MNNILHHHTTLIIDSAHNLLNDPTGKLNDKQITFVKKILANAEQFIHLYAQFESAPIELVTADMRHDLGNPLTPINGYSELLLMEVIGSLSARQQIYAQTIFDSTYALRDEVEAIVDKARQFAGQTA